MTRVDVIIAAHNPQRPVGRAAASIVRGNPEARCVVVAHNLGRAAIVEVLPEDIRAEVNVIELQDGIPAPSGPFNHGIAQSTAEFVSIMGSDDLLDPGAVRSWLHLADRYRADAVIARVVRGQERTLVRSPVVRPFHRGVLDLTRDRLSYRSAPLGLVRRSAIAEYSLLLSPGARSGGDLEFVTRLWALGRCVYAGTGPGYVEMSEATDRVTHRMKPVSEELHWARELLDSDWFRGLPAPARRVTAVKLVRRNLVDTMLKRRELAWSNTEAESLADIAERILHCAPRVGALLSLAELALLEAVHAQRTQDFPAAVALAKAYPQPRALLGRGPESVLHPAGPLRFALAGALMR